VTEQCQRAQKPKDLLVLVHGDIVDLKLSGAVIKRYHISLGNGTVAPKIINLFNLPSDTGGD
jgi:hypothetical protein